MTKIKIILKFLYIFQYQILFKSVKCMAGTERQGQTRWIQFSTFHTVYTVAKIYIQKRNGIYKNY